MEHLQNIKGINHLIHNLPQEYRSFHLFGNILKIECTKVFDDDKYEDVYNINLLITDENELYKIQLSLKNAHGDISFTVSEPLSGLAIYDMTEYGYEQDSRFRVYDFENGDFSIYCEDIGVALLKG